MWPAESSQGTSLEASCFCTSKWLELLEENQVAFRFWLKVNYHQACSHRMSCGCVQSCYVDHVCGGDCRASELRHGTDSKSFSRRSSGMPQDYDKGELDRERKELKNLRAELERRVADLDKRQVSRPLHFP